MFSEVTVSANTLIHNTMLVGLLQNTAILLSLSLLYEAVWLKREISNPLPGKILTGVVIGCIAMVLMKTPWTYVPGIVFDTRSVLLATSGLFFGAIPTAIAMGMAAALRIFHGGDGMWMGIAVIFSSGIIGILWQQFRPLKAIRKQWLELLAMGFVVHLAMLICAFLLPKETMWQTFLLLIMPLLMVYTPATMLLGLLLIRQKRNHLNRMAAIKLLESEQKFRNLFEHHSAVKLIIDPQDGHIVDANSAAADFYGWSIDELRNMQINQINTLSYEQLKTEMNNVLKNSRIHFEFRHRKKDGNIVDVETFSSKIEVGGKTYLHSIIHDVTEKKQLMLDLIAAKERAEENDKLKTLFLMNMSHEIRTPLNGILGFASILADTPFEPDQTRNYAEIIQKSGQRLLSLINDMIDVSKIESGVERAELAEVNAYGALYEATSQFSAQAAKKNLTLTTAVSESDMEVMIVTDPRKLHQILINLINNAIKFSEQGTITTGFQLNPSQIVFYIKDEGIGIPYQYQNQVFNRFFQAHIQDDSGNPGTGLGLTICKGLATLLGGSVQLQSEPGKGTTVFLHLPLDPGV